MLKRSPGRWALDYEKCIRCEQADTKHMGKGLCRRCYFADYNTANLKAIQAYKRKWYRKAGGAAWGKALREQRNFGGLREAALQRDEYKCVRCGTTQQLCVHHKDRKGRNVPIGQKNNTLENFETICCACHLAEHRGEQKRPTSAQWIEIVKRGWATRRAKQQQRKEG